MIILPSCLPPAMATVGCDHSGNAISGDSVPLTAAAAPAAAAAAVLSCPVLPADVRPALQLLNKMLESDPVDPKLYAGGCFFGLHQPFCFSLG
jgi:hypothetical protein